MAGWAPPGSKPVAGGGLAALARDALAALLALVPRAIWRGVKGGLAGFFVAGVLGLAAAGGAALWLTLPDWLVWTQLVWVPSTLSIAGAYIGAVNGLLTAVADELERQGLASRLYGIVKPACVAAARKLASRAPGRGGPIEVGAALFEELAGRLGDDDVPAERGVGARVERFLALRSRKVLCLSAVRGITQAKDPAAARAALESLGVQHLQAWMVETVEDLFFVQLVLAAAIALVLAALPALLFALGVALGG